MLFSRVKTKSDTIPAIPYDRCYAKTDENGQPGLSVEQHLLNVAAVSRALKQELPESLQVLGGLAIHAAMVHDVGKVSPGFQIKCCPESVAAAYPEIARFPLSSFCTDHAHTGACSLWSYSGDRFNCPGIAQVAAIHHGSARSDPCHSDAATVFGGPAWSSQRKLLLQALEKKYGKLDTGILQPVQVSFVAGMVTISDWIGSDEYFFPAQGFPAGTDLAAVAAEALAVCGLNTPSIVPDLSFEDIFGFPAFEMQEQFGSLVTEPGVYVLEAPMGMGKTEAALYAAYRLMVTDQNRGFFFGLPTRLTSDRIYERVESFLDSICSDSARPRLAHGTAWLTEYKHGGHEFLPGQAWFNPRKRALLHPFVVGTIDQALMSVLRVKHYFVRSFGLAGKVVILDEVHSYDSYTGTLMDDMVSHLVELGCSVIILSATLTAERRSAFFRNRPASLIPDYPLITGETVVKPLRPPDNRTYSVSIQDLSVHDVAKKAVEKASQAHCVLCIANTVAGAQAWYDAVSAEAIAGSFPIGLLHSKFPGFQRSEIENAWMSWLGKSGERPMGCILIATQVVEQSVDIDADYLITELAPTDMLLQRMGRQWRHDRKNRPCACPETVIISGDPGPVDDIDGVYNSFGLANCKVYAPWVLWQTRHVWIKHKKIDIPADIRNLLEETYDWQPHKASPLLGTLRKQFEEMRDSLTGKAQANLSTVTSMPVGEDHEGCATRYSDLPTLQALLVKKIDSTGRRAALELLSGRTVTVSEFEVDMGVTAELHRNLVALPVYLVSRTAVPQTPAFLAKHFYEATPVLLWDESSGILSLDNKPTEFRYNPRKGIFRLMPTEQKGSTQEMYLSDFEEIAVFDKSRFDW